MMSEMDMAFPPMRKEPDAKPRSRATQPDPKQLTRVAGTALVIGESIRFTGGWVPNRHFSFGHLRARLGALDLGGAKLEFGNLSEWIERWIGEEVGGRLDECERNE